MEDDLSLLDLEVEQWMRKRRVKKDVWVIIGTLVTLIVTAAFITLLALTNF